MRPIGFSTGALAKGDVELGVAIQADLDGANAVELSALRVSELEPLLAVLPRLDLAQLAHVSVHAPSSYPAEEESAVVARLGQLPASWPIIIHPDAIHDAAAWRDLGSRLVIENMDARKKTGRRVEELEPFFEDLPDAGFCLDVAHALHVDSAMGELRNLIRAFGHRLIQLHLSSVDRSGEHRGLDAGTERYRALLESTPEGVAVILESVVPRDELQAELSRARQLFRS